MVTTAAAAASAARMTAFGEVRQWPEAESIVQLRSRAAISARRREVTGNADGAMKLPEWATPRASGAARCSWAAGTAASGAVLESCPEIEAHVVVRNYANYAMMSPPRMLAG